MTSLPKINWLDNGQLERVVRLEKLPAFKGLVTTVESSEVCHHLEPLLIGLSAFNTVVCCQLSELHSICLNLFACSFLFVFSLLFLQSF